MKKGPTSKRYDEATKRKIVAALVRGDMSVSEVRRKYNITGGMTIKGWMTKYADSGKSSVKAKGKAVPAGASKVLSGDLSVIRQENKRLEKELSRAEAQRDKLQKKLKDIEDYFGKGYKNYFA